MAPRAKDFAPKHENGIRRVCEAYEKYLPQFGVEFVTKKEDADLLVDHAGMLKGEAHCAMLHGLYWSADMVHPRWELKANRDVILALRSALQITVPSKWVAHNIARDARVYPHVVGHGIDYENWQTGNNAGYILWNKNRISDACDPTPLEQMATKFPNLSFVSTFAPNNPGNIYEVGVVPHQAMKEMVENCAVYLASVKETFGLGILEAMAAGKPILGYAWGGILDLVQHGVNGYLAQPGNEDDLFDGLGYCLDNYDTLGKNSREMAKQYSWLKACEKVSNIYRMTLESLQSPPTVSLVIPVFDYVDKVSGAIESALKQTHEVEIIVVNDGSTDNSGEVIDRYASEHPNVTAIHQKNNGVASARNTGIQHASGKYICCLDADDAIAPSFIEKLVPTLENDRSLGIAYTGLYYITPDGKQGKSKWPGEFDYNAQLKAFNQVPTCCLFRKEMWERLGGYKERCQVRNGAGFEDADFWLRAGAYGYGAKLATAEPLFIYSYGSGRVSNMNKAEMEDFYAQEAGYMRTWYPWIKGDQPLFASLATPESYSHPVRQYDQPDVSVVIPVGPGHLQSAWQALDSLEAQTYRRWEVIVVIDHSRDWDDDEKELMGRTLKAYPYAHFLRVKDGPKGAGCARNLGAKHAKAPMLLFLDADDWLYREFLEKTLQAWSATGHAVYTDYTGKAIVKNPNELADNLVKQIKYHNPDTGETIIEYKAADYDCSRALRQPDDPPWIWNNITTLFPTAWHEEVGGFDESLPSWEDVLYWYTMARKGKCFTRIAEPLMVCQFHTGSRRDWAHKESEAGKNWELLIQYIQKVLEGVKDMGCRGCGGGQSPAPIRQPIRSSEVANLSGDAGWVPCVYQSSNIGDVSVQLLCPDGQMRAKKLAPGDKLLVHVSDMKKHGGRFRKVEDVKLPEIQPGQVTAPVAVGTEPVEVSTDELEATNPEWAEFVKRRAKDIKAKSVTVPPPPPEPDAYQQANHEFKEAKANPTKVIDDENPEFEKEKPKPKTTRKRTTKRRTSVAKTEAK